MLPGVGIFGTGVLARATVHFLKESGFKIVAVWSRTLAEAKKFATELAIPFSTNRADDLLLKSEVGFVVIACTPHLQSPIAVKALGIGKHVIASWPAGTSQLEVLKMVKAATYYPSLLSMMCHGIRFLPSYIMMKEKVEEGLIGEVYLFEIRVHSQAGFSEYDWRCDGMMGGGALSIHGSYIIDTVSYLSGKNIKSVNGMVKTYVKTTQTVNGVREITGDDFCSFQMILDGGVTVSCTINNLCEGESLHEVIVVGSKGRLIAKDLDLYVRLSDHVGKESCLHEGCKDDTNNALSDSASQRAPFFKGKCHCTYLTFTYLCTYLGL